MCGCGSTALSVTATASNYSKCSGAKTKITILRNKLIYMEKVTTDPTLIQDYKDARSELEILLKNSSAACPNETDLQILSDYVDDEYAKYN